MSLEKDLLKETLKWINRAEKELRDVKINDQKFARNVKAYVMDSKYFLEKEDLIRAFECIIWAWAWIEIGKEVGLITQE
jgi:hypothetical protein